ncbi:HAUS augmin-like complex subunit 5 isoform X1 [Hippocampus zosterae]|uniref:HAUS augmin-like complex subunit 5 isoform X1 n=2 Tax=Hippocampus zosterae TaxID=109293 RepID=UPI00223D717C|nr:HAUS augmin-like complex subunit 5 isoform X1 [Hippocampus zosterae]
MSSRMADKHLVQDLKLWATEEFNFPPESLPPDSYLKTLCAGRGRSIWKYIINHVFQQRTVKLRRGNLHWYKMLQDNEAKQREGQSVAAKKSELQSKIEQLKSEIGHLDSEIRATEEQLVTRERSISSTWAQVEDSQERNIFLQAFKQSCVSGRKMLSSDIQEINGYCQDLEQMARKAEVEVLFENQLPSNCDVDALLFKSPVEAQVLRQVRKLCNDRVHFYQSLQESELKTADFGRMTGGQRSAVFQYWLNGVVNLMDVYPPKHILAALQHLASEEQKALDAKVSSLDVTQDVKALGFRYESNLLLDISAEDDDDLPPEALLQAARQEVKERFDELSQTHSRVQQLHIQLLACRQQAEQKVSSLVDDRKNDALALSVLDLELQCVMKAAVRDHIREWCIQVDQDARGQQESLRKLRSQRQTIVDFRQQVVQRQEQITSLIKGNSSAKTELIRMHEELQDFLKSKLLPQCQDVTAAANSIRNSISKEVRQMGNISLQALDRRTVDGIQRIPSLWLSIHRLQSPTFSSLCQNMVFPLYRAPEELCAQAYCDQLERRFLSQLLQLHSTTLRKSEEEAAHLLASDQNALLSRVKEEDKKLLKSLVPRARILTQKCAEGLSYGETVQMAISDWWDQPAQHVLPDVQKRGLTFQQWRERWNLAKA